ncbi:MAG: pyridoxal kinase [Rhodospirillales bacterium]|nr:pyridoxal kinase [Rhodospirillales bacterium]
MARRLDPQLLLISSLVAVGRVGARASLFAFERLGFEAALLPTVLYSNHPGHGRFSGRPLAPARLADLADGLARHGFLAACAGAMSGYLGQAGAVGVCAKAIRRLKSARPNALYLCDPVLGDADKGLYVPQSLARALARDLLPLADILTPNPFELAYLSGHTIASRADLLAASRALIDRGPRWVVTTSARLGDTPKGRLDVIAVSATQAWRVRTPLLPGTYKGAGDLFAALLLAHRLRKRPMPEALARAVDATYRAVAATRKKGAGELALLSVQKDLDRPADRAAQPLRSSPGIRRAKRPGR